MSNGNPVVPRICSVVLMLGALLLCATTAAVPSRAQAAVPQAQITTPLVFTSTTADTSGSGYSWNHDSLTLTLTGIDISVSAYDSVLGTGSAITVPDGATIAFSGANTVTTSVAAGSASQRYCAIEGAGTLTIEGAVGSTLSASATGAGGIGIGSNGALALSGGTLTVAAVSTDSNLNATGVFSGGALTIAENASLTSTAQVTGYVSGEVAQGHSYGIFVSDTAGSSSISNSTVTAESNAMATASAIDMLFYDALTVSSSKLESTGFGMRFSHSLTVENASTVSFSHPSSPSGIAVNGDLVVDSSAVDSACTTNAIDIGKGSLIATNSTITCTANVGSNQSAMRVNWGNVTITDSTLTAMNTGTKSRGLNIITPQGATEPCMLIVNSGRVELDSTQAGLVFNQSAVDPSTNHLSLGAGMRVLEGGTLRYTEWLDGSYTDSCWSFSDQESISYSHGTLFGASANVVIDKAAPTPAPAPAPSGDSSSATATAATDDGMRGPSTVCIAFIAAGTAAAACILARRRLLRHR